LLCGRCSSGFIAYFGVVLSRFTGENFMDKNKPKNAFDNLFFHCIAMALLVYAIAIPFYRMDYTSLPLTVGILAGLIALARSQPEHCRYNGVSCAAPSIVRQALSGDRFARGVHPIDDGFSV
jgi:hypothetical protein